MHSMEGALSESLYIYKPCIKKALSHPNSNILSMGLGLGYNEIIIAVFSVKQDSVPYQMVSFELFEELEDSFASWILGENTSLNSCYDLILTKTAEALQVAASSIKDHLCRQLNSKQLLLAGALPTTNPFPYRFHGILYDAFSGESDESLWSEDHLVSFLNNFAAIDYCYLTTYAATGNLKRSLKKLHFEITKTKGFGKKRESTTATRAKPIEHQQA